MVQSPFHLVRGSGVRVMLGVIPGDGEEVKVAGSVAKGEAVGVCNEPPQPAMRVRKHQKSKDEPV